MGGWGPKGLACTSVPIAFLPQQRPHRIEASLCGRRRGKVWEQEKPSVLRVSGLAYFDPAATSSPTGGRYHVPFFLSLSLSCRLFRAPPQAWLFWIGMSCPASIHGIVDVYQMSIAVLHAHVHVHVHVPFAPDALVHAHAHAMLTTSTTAAASSPRKPPQAPPSRLVHHGPALPGRPGPMVSGPISS